MAEPNTAFLRIFRFGTRIAEPGAIRRFERRLKNMRIVDNNSPANMPLGQAGRTAETQATGSTGKSGSNAPLPGGTDGLKLSRFTGTISQAIQGDSATRSQRVAQLSAAYKSGSYHVDPAAVSRAIVDHAISAASDAQ
jgi:anti-sigma28 factor (negative regulator of flagellin synthesis)